MAATHSIAAARAREIVTVTGRIVSIEVQPRNALPTLTARVSDGSQVVDAVFLGRREIFGMTPGARVTVSGRMSYTDSVPRLFNPRFELS